MPTLLSSPRRALALLAVACSLALPAEAQRGAVPRLRRDTVRANDGHALVLWSRRPAGRARGAILLLHGRTWSALPNFDLHVPGERVSLMESLAARGWVAYALDQRGYGATSRDSTRFLTPVRAADDALDALRWIAARERSAALPALLGYSQGARTAMLAAQRDSSRMSAVVLYGFPADLSAMPTVVRDSSAPEWRRTTAEGASEDFITPESTPAGVKEAYVRAAIAADSVRMDWRGLAEWRALDAARVRVPVLVINGERDPYTARANLPYLMSRLAGVDHAWVVLARADHAAHLERQREYVNALLGFLERGAR